jgi:hypothetical protein
VCDVDEHDVTAFPRFARARKAALEVILQPGDVLYIPALWAHHVTALHGPSVALNVFYRHLAVDMYPSKDLYGNADPLAASNAMKSLDALMDSLKQLPQDYRVFYAGVASAKLENHLGVDAARRSLALARKSAHRTDSHTNSTREANTVMVARVIACVSVLALGLKSIFKTKH